jgi:hypothetical protein
MFRRILDVHFDLVLDKFGTLGKSQGTDSLLNIA